uniref:Uncharacterized protein n=1 Tax=Salvator merianae TaxID=96440 RepID=A0A8D0ECL5_SALMN
MSEKKQPVNLGLLEEDDEAELEKLKPGISGWILDARMPLPPSNLDCS